MPKTPEQIAEHIIFSNPLLDWSDPEFPDALDLWTSEERTQAFVTMLGAEVFSLTPDQARHILAWLSEQSRGAE